MGLGSVLLAKNDICFVSKHVVQRLLCFIAYLHSKERFASLKWVVAMSVEAPAHSQRARDNPNLSALRKSICLFSISSGGEIPLFKALLIFFH